MLTRSSKSEKLALERLARLDKLRLSLEQQIVGRQDFKNQVTHTGARYIRLRKLQAISNGVRHSVAGALPSALRRPRAAYVLRWRLSTRGSKRMQHAELRAFEATDFYVLPSGRLQKKKQHPTIVYGFFPSRPVASRGAWSCEAFFFRYHRCSARCVQHGFDCTLLIGRSFFAIGCGSSIRSSRATRARGRPWRPGSWRVSSSGAASSQHTVESSRHGQDTGQREECKFRFDIWYRVLQTQFRWTVQLFGEVQKEDLIAADPVQAVEKTLKVA